VLGFGLVHAWLGFARYFTGIEVSDKGEIAAVMPALPDESAVG
jgi:hypothetical protein